MATSAWTNPSLRVARIPHRPQLARSATQNRPVARQCMVIGAAARPGARQKPELARQETYETGRTESPPAADARVLQGSPHGSTVIG